ncbi:MAG: DUF59 domain-containing protein [Anaerolineales bacterium]|nr:DUF59 domain-containing protein [Anaerolineales bacterium]
MKKPGMDDPAADASPKTVWQADRSHPERAASLRKALGEVMDPELGLSIIQLGMIRDVQLKENGVFLRMILTTPFCPYGPALMEHARQKAEKAVALPATIEMGDEAWKPSMMEDDAGGDWGLLY